MTEFTVATGGHYPTELLGTDSGGVGRPVVLIHGWPSSQQSWQPIAERLLAAGHRVISYDRRGFGRSGKPAEGYDYETFTDDLDALITELDLRDAVLVGFSMGGGEVARYIARERAQSNSGSPRVGAGVFVAAIPPCLDADLADNPEGAFTAAAATQMQDGLMGDPEGFLRGFLGNFYAIPSGDGPRLMVGEDVIDEALRIAKQGRLEALSACIRLWLTDFRTDLAAFDVPTLVIHGLGDQIVPFAASGARIGGLVPQATTVTIPDGPHGLLASHLEQVAQAILDFLD